MGGLILSKAGKISWGLEIGNRLTLDLPICHIPGAEVSNIRDPVSSEREGMSMQASIYTVALVAAAPSHRYVPHRIHTRRKYIQSV